MCAVRKWQVQASRTWGPRKKKEGAGWALADERL
jgi:hypothetical protein